MSDIEEMLEKQIKLLHDIGDVLNDVTFFESIAPLGYLLGYAGGRLERDGMAKLDVITLIEKMLSAGYIDGVQPDRKSNRRGKRISKSAALREVEKLLRGDAP